MALIFNTLLQKMISHLKHLKITTEQLRSEEQLKYYLQKY